MSANLLRHPGKLHTLTDDLESFLHVLGWMTLRYVPASNTYLAFHRGLDMAIFDEHYQQQGHSDQGGHLKFYVLAAGKYPSSSFQPRHETPLFKLLQDLRKPFKSLYGEPPTDEDRKNAKNLPNISNESQLLLCAAVFQHDRDIRCLQSSTWFINMVKTALNDKAWPTDDTADENLPIVFSGETQRQTQNRTNELRNTHSLWENSKGLSSNSKRAASPTPEPSAKRRRGTPPTSGTQN